MHSNYFEYIETCSSCLNCGFFHSQGSMSCLHYETNCEWKGGNLILLLSLDLNAMRMCLYVVYNMYNTQTSLYTVFDCRDKEYILMDSTNRLHGITWYGMVQRRHSVLIKQQQYHRWTNKCKQNRKLNYVYNTYSMLPKNPKMRRIVPREKRGWCEKSARNWLFFFWFNTILFSTIIPFPI